jgi:hypothetical protein
MSSLETHRLKSRWLWFQWGPAALRSSATALATTTSITATPVPHTKSAMSSLMMWCCRRASESGHVETHKDKHHKECRFHLEHHHGKVGGTGCTRHVVRLCHGATGSGSGTAPQAVPVRFRLRLCERDLVFGARLCHWQDRRVCLESQSPYYCTMSGASDLLHCCVRVSGGVPVCMALCVCSISSK